MNKLTVVEEHRGRGIGIQVTAYWENLLRERGYLEVLNQRLQMNAVSFSIESWVIRIVEPCISPMNRSKSSGVRPLSPKKTEHQILNLSPEGEKIT